MKNGGDYTFSTPLPGGQPMSNGGDYQFSGQQDFYQQQQAQWAAQRQGQADQQAWRMQQQQDQQRRAQQQQQPSYGAPTSGGFTPQSYVNQIQANKAASRHNAANAFLAGAAGAAAISWWQQTHPPRPKKPSRQDRARAAHFAPLNTMSANERRDRYAAMNYTERLEFQRAEYAAWKALNDEWEAKTAKTAGEPSSTFTISKVVWFALAVAAVVVVRTVFGF